MRTRFFALTAAFIIALAQVPAAFAKNSAAPADWTSVQSLTPGEKIAVRTKDGDRLKGRFDSATETDINFTEDGRKVTLKRDSVRRVEIARGKKRWQGALVGAGAALGLGTNYETVYEAQ
jgi:hypothetical protein